MVGHSENQVNLDEAQKLQKLLIWDEFEFEWEFYALSASKAIFRARAYDCITYSVW